MVPPGRSRFKARNEFNAEDAEDAENSNSNGR